LYLPPICVWFGRKTGFSRRWTPMDADKTKTKSRRSPYRRASAAQNSAVID
jgi:hypothetical protein